MIIKRIQVEEGFLDGLDLDFSDGLNTIIGPRGVGKTSIIELIRFCLRSPALTEKVSITAQEHALSILGSGRVTVTVEQGEETFDISRTAATDGEEPSKATDPLVLSQNEIESVGLYASGRLRLIDSIVADQLDSSATSEIDGLLALIRSQTGERVSVSSELQSMRLQIKELAEQVAQAEALSKQHAEALKSIENAKKETDRLNTLGSWLAALSVRNNVYTRTLATIQQYHRSISNLSAYTPEVEAWPVAADSEEDPLQTLRLRIQEASDSITFATNTVGDAIAQVSALIKGNSEQMRKYEEEARSLRRHLDTLKHGSSEIARRMVALREKAGQLSALKALEKAKLARLSQIQRDRRSLLERLENARLLKFQRREKVVQNLNEALGPRIQISIERAGITTEYASAIAAALRGSGLKFNDVAQAIADQISPMEFVDIIEREDFEALAEITAIGAPRAAKIIERIAEHGIENILTAVIEDGVEFKLLDGSIFKPTEDLSTGQRCTVILPIILQQKWTAIIVDQPEDHLDTAFIVETLIKCIQERKGQGQLIFSTHNPNIPVLGEADQVTLLGSDGKRGFVRHSGTLTHPKSVEAITTVMEGGLDAFKRRALFYGT